MIKKILLVFCSLLVLGGCGSGEKSVSGNDSADKKENVADKETKTTEKEKTVLTSKELESELNKQEVHVIKTNYAVQDEEANILYPDVLQAIFKNGSKQDIKKAVISFVAWDSNNLPVKIKANIDFGEGAYIYKCNYNDINLVPGATYGETSGFEISQDIDIHTFKAIVKSYETFDGITWENPQYDNWTEMYGGVKYSDTLSIEL